MTDAWSRHISKGLAESGRLAYQWNIMEDRYEWIGDLNGLLGGSGDHPKDNGQFHRFLNPQHVPERLSALYAVLSGQEEEFSATYKIQRADGTQMDVRENGAVHITEGGEKFVYGFIAAASPDARASGQTERRNVHSMGGEFSISHQGRVRIIRSIDQWLGRSRDEQSGKGFLLTLGLDHFSLYNEAYGAAFCDSILEDAGQRLRQCAGSGAEVARIDGDVYGLFFADTPYCDMAAMARHLITQFYKQPFDTMNGRITFGASVGGIVLRHGLSMTPGSILASAETALHKAKNRGRGCFHAHEPSSQDIQDTRQILKTGNDLIRAFHEGRMRLAFQPVMDMNHNAASFHEALVRMIDDTGRLQSAAQFIPAIERLGLSRMVDHFALTQAIEELSRFSDLSLSVNVSNQTLNDPDWLRFIVGALRDQPSVAKRLIIEITETTAISSMDVAIMAVRTLRDIGCRVALDDFGAGYTAFLQLKTLGVDIVKIDKSFTRGLSDSKNQLFVRTLQLLADGIDIMTVGEGAETLAEARILARDGVNLVQGYVFGFPQVERVWLPKDHSHRKITMEGISADASEWQSWEAGKIKA